MVLTNILIASNEVANGQWFDDGIPDEIESWFKEEGFSEIKLRMIKQNINMNGILS